MIATAKYRVALALCTSLSGASLTACLEEGGEGNPEHPAPEVIKVLGGQAIDSSVMPTVVAIKVADLAGDASVSNSYCTGVLISQRHVLTNAHCFLPVSSADSHAKIIGRTHVFFDTENNRETPAVDVMAADIAIHDEFSLPAGVELGYADLAVVTLATTMTDRVASPISFAAADAPITGNYIVAGYGMYNSAGDTGILHRVFDRGTSCAPAGEPDDAYICIDRADRTGAASGDSGSAIFVDKGGIPTVVATHTYTLTGGGANPNFGLAQRASNAYYREFIESFGDDVACATNTLCNDACGERDLDCAAAEPGGGGGVDEPIEPPCGSCEPAAGDDEAGTGGCQTSTPATPIAWVVMFAAAALVRRRRAKTSA